MKESTLGEPTLTELVEILDESVRHLTPRISFTRSPSTLSTTPVSVQEMRLRKKSRPRKIEDPLATLLRRSNELPAAEFDEALLRDFHGDYGTLEGIYQSGVIPLFLAVEADPRCLRLAAEIRILIADLEQAGLAPSQGWGQYFALPTSAALKQSQVARDSAPDDALIDLDYRRAFPKLLRSYAQMYEAIISTKVRPLARLISGKKPPRAKALVLEIVRSYNASRYQSLFDAFHPEIRNSIQHEDRFIHPTRPEVTFMEEGQPISTWTFEAFKALHLEVLCWSVAFSYVIWKSQEPFLLDLMAKLRRLKSFVEKSDYRLVPSETGPSLYDIASALPPDDRED